MRQYLADGFGFSLEGALQLFVEDSQQIVSVQRLFSDAIIGVNVQGPNCLGLAAIDAPQKRAINLCFISNGRTVVVGEGELQRVHGDNNFTIFIKWGETAVLSNFSKQENVEKEGICGGCENNNYIVSDFNRKSMFLLHLASHLSQSPSSLYDTFTIFQTQR